MPTLGDWAGQVREAVAAGDRGSFLGLVEDLAHENPRAAAELAAGFLVWVDHDPDAYDPSAECHVWVKAERVIGGPSHTHVCRRRPTHADQHLCMCGHEWARRP